eukprot:2006085-Pleurochrysis_carterae.AAC.1
MESTTTIRPNGRLEGVASVDHHEARTSAGLACRVPRGALWVMSVLMRCACVCAFAPLCACANPPMHTCVYVPICVYVLMRVFKRLYDKANAYACECACERSHEHMRAHACACAPAWACAHVRTVPSVERTRMWISQWAPAHMYPRTCTRAHVPAHMYPRTRARAYAYHAFARAQDAWPLQLVRASARLAAHRSATERRGAQAVGGSASNGQSQSGAAACARAVGRWSCLEPRPLSL